MKSLSLLAEKYQEVQFNDPAVMVEAHSPHQLLESLKGYNETHDLKAVFNYIAESKESGSTLVTKSLIEENAEAAATILAIEKILTYYVEGKDSEFNKKVLLTLEDVGAYVDAPKTLPPKVKKKTAPVNPAQTPGSKGGGFMAGVKNVVGKGLEYLGKAAGKFASGAQSGKGTGSPEEAPYETHETQADLSTLARTIVPTSAAILTSTYGVPSDMLAKLKTKQISGITLSRGDKFAEIKFDKNGLYTIRSLMPAEKSTIDKKKVATKKVVTKPPVVAPPVVVPPVVAPPAVNSSYVPFSSLASKVLKEFYSTNKPLPLETNSKK